MLNNTQLKDDLLSVFDSAPETGEIAAEQIATAYDAYSKDAESCSSLKPTIVNYAGMESALKTLFGVTNPAEAAATAFANAVTLYWTGAAFGTGVVSLIPGTVALASGLKTLWETQANDENATTNSSAQQHADLLHTFTLSIQVTDPAIPCGPAPII